MGKHLKHSVLLAVLATATVSHAFAASNGSGSGSIDQSAKPVGQKPEALNRQDGRAYAAQGQKAQASVMAARADKPVAAKDLVAGQKAQAKSPAHGRQLAKKQGRNQGTHAT